MEDRSEDRKSSWEKVTDPPARVFLEKSATPAGVFSFFCQKNAEAGVAMDTTSARASRSATAVTSAPLAWAAAVKSE